jgi:UDP:flavonoid glycosyltransferase YjiC (YdhE family)
VSRILLAWELGTGFGHLGTFFALVPRLLERGHELHIAAREVAGAVKAVGTLSVAVHQSPVCLNSYGGLQEPPLNYAEILMRYGYLDPAMLRGLLAAWRSLQRAVGANVVIADHAPTALLAARSDGRPAAVIGSPFAVPPAAHPTPNMRPWVQVPAARLLDSDARVLAVINDVLPAAVPRLPALHAMFDGAAQFFMGLPETDPYGVRPGALYLGVTGRSSGAARPSWPAGDGPRVLAYLHGDYPHAQATIAALAAAGARTIVYVLGGSAAQLRAFAAAGVAVSAEPLDLDELLPGSDLCVSHGLGTAIAALQAGVPLLMLPKQLENFLFALALQRMGVAALVNPEQPQPDIRAQLSEVLQSGRHAAAAKAFAARWRGEPVDTMAAQVVARIEALAALRQGGDP